MSASPNQRGKTPALAAPRRRFLQMATAGAVAAVTAAAPGTLPSRAVAAGSAAALVLSCIDYRLTSEVVAFMNGLDLTDAYDQVILAGAALGAQAEAYPAWSTTFWQHLDLAIQLHGIERVIVIDHRDCGAYRLVLGEDLAADPDRETQVHAQWQQALRDAIAAQYPSLTVDLYLMALDGTAEALG